MLLLSDQYLGTNKDYDMARMMDILKILPERRDADRMVVRAWRRRVVFASIYGMLVTATSYSGC